MSEQFGIENTNDVSAAFDLLRDARRRGVLYTVNRNGRTSVEEIARRIAAWQAEDDGESPDPESIELSLVHTHLPKLDEADAVDYDRESGTVEPTEAVADLEPFLGCTREREPGLFYVSRPSKLDRVLGI